MRSDLTLTELAKELDRQNTVKQDFVADSRHIMMTDDAKISFIAGEHRLLEANDVAHKQIASRLEIPGRYYDRLRGDAPQLLANNVNHWLHQKPETRMIRTLDGKVRAFLSDRYQRIENYEIAQVAIKALLQQQGVQIMSCAVTETRLYIKAVFPKVEGEVRKGDLVQAGVAISNSEVGLGAVKIEPLVYRLVCTNGMILNDSRYMARHLGGRIAETDDVREMLTDESVKADDTAVMLKVRDVINGSFDQVRFQRQIELMQGATERKIEGNPAETVKLLAKKQSFNQFEEGSVLRNLIEGADLSQWGLLNAVTATAKEQALSYDRATELETLGGTMLTMPANEWSALAKAA